MKTAAQKRLNGMVALFSSFTPKQKVNNGSSEPKPDIVLYVVTPPRTIPQGRAGIDPKLGGQNYSAMHQDPNGGMLSSNNVCRGGDPKKQRRSFKF